MTRVAIVGGAGFVGRHVVRRFQGSGIAAVTIDRRPAADPAPRETMIECDLGRPPEILKAAAGCGAVDAVVWLAAPMEHRTRESEASRAALAGMAEAPVRFLAALASPPASFVLVSSIQVYGEPEYLPVDEEHPTRPTSPYGAAKLGAERGTEAACQDLAAALAILRPAFIYGPGQHNENVIPKFLTALARGESPLVYGVGDGVRDDVYVGDVARVIALCVERRATGTFNVAGGRPRTLLEVAETACRVSGTGLRPHHAAADGGWVDRWFSVERARRLLDFEAETSLEEGLRAMWHLAVGESTS